MQRLSAILALAFAFAALAGVSTAHAHRFVSTPIVVLNLVDAQNQSIPVVVKVQRGQIGLGAGIVMPCAPYHALEVAAPKLRAPPSMDLPETEPALTLAGCLPGIPMRPPISA